MKTAKELALSGLTDDLNQNLTSHQKQLSRGIPDGEILASNTHKGLAAAEFLALWTLKWAWPLCNPQNVPHINLVNNNEHWKMDQKS